MNLYFVLKNLIALVLVFFFVQEQYPREGLFKTDCSVMGSCRARMKVMKLVRERTGTSPVPHLLSPTASEIFPIILNGCHRERLLPTFTRVFPSLVLSRSSQIKLKPLPDSLCINSETVRYRCVFQVNSNSNAFDFFFTDVYDSSKYKVSDSFLVTNIVF